MLDRLIINTSNIDKIKKLKPSANNRYKQGYLNPDKVKKNVGIGPIIYRSSLEYKFINWLERSPSVKTWASEIGFVTYIHENELHRYFIDFVFEDFNNNIFYVEVKPRQIVMEHKNNPDTKNYKKWEAMLKLCNENEGHYFKIITEKFFTQKN